MAGSMEYLALTSPRPRKVVTGIEVAGRPGLDSSKLTPLFQQHVGEPFSRQKVDQSIAALKSAGKVSEVQLQVEPEANGVRILLIEEPAIFNADDGNLFHCPTNDPT